MITLTPIGWVRGGRVDPDDDNWGDVQSVIELDDERFGSAALAGLDAFSHIEVVYVFDKVADTSVEMGSRHPRGRADWPEVGIFAQRAKNRPGRLGVTTCALVRVDGLRVLRVGPRRHRRDPGVGHQAVHDRICAARRGAGAGLGARTDPRLLVSEQPFGVLAHHIDDLGGRRDLVYRGH